MNYIFRQAVINFAVGKKASATVAALEMLRENYPRPVFYRLMNLTSTHDLPRTLWEVGYKDYGMGNYENARKKLLLTVALQFTYPGAPTIYYGDEVGMTGGNDPLNRGPYPWADMGGNYGDPSLLDVYKGLSAMRQKYASIFVTGEIAMLPGNDNMIVYERYDSASRAITLLNNSKTTNTLALAV
jgi:glycosidase